MLHSFKTKGKKWVSFLFLLTLSISFANAQDYYPYVIGYTAGESVKHQTSADTFNVSFHGGSVVATKFIKDSVNNRYMAGMRYDLVLAANAFDQDLFVSKGYFADYVQLRWEIKKYQTSVTAYRVYRRKVGSTDALIQVAFLSKDVSDWKDEFTESGVLYEYKLLAEGLFPKQQKFLNFIEGVGFRLPSATISGRVTYKGGAAVEGVSLIAETEDKFSGTSLYLNGTDAYLGISPPLDHPHFKFDTAFTFQAWVKPTSTTTSVIFQKGSQYKLTHSTGKLDFTAGTQTLTINFAQKADTFFHVSAVRERDSLKLVVMYQEGIYYSTKVKLTSATTPNNIDILMGKSSTNTQYFRGYIDEVRLWHRALENVEILTKSLMYIAGTEVNLSGYYRMNEAVGGNFFDLSRRGFDFNEKHGFIYKATWSTVIPLSVQLAVKGLTDKNGNYIISGVPYSSDGSSYRIVPIYLVHSFDPTERLLFIGPGSNSFSDVNFIDVSSFPVQGYVYYKDTDFPVEGVQIKIDGRTAVTSEGNVITTDAKGYFLIDVPIGLHNLQLSKPGHVFRNNGRFPATAGQTFDFQSAYTIQQDFIDTTLVKVIGKVVGGPREGAKKNGFGNAKNNVGNATITLSTQKGYFLSDNSVGVSGTWPNQYYQGKVLKNVGNTGYQITSTNRKSININPSSVTGEYMAYLLPEKYTISSVLAGDYPDETSFHTTLDLENSTFNFNRTDTILVDSSILGNGQVKYNYRTDSLSYNSEKDFIFRVAPEISVLEASGIPAFWEMKAPTPTGGTIDIVDANKNPLTDYPVFKQLEKYKLKITVFEKYVNKQTGVADNVPVTDGKVEIQNALAIDDSKQAPKDINEFGFVSYEFTGGLPNTTAGTNDSYLKSMAITALTGKDNSITTDWLYKGKPFKGYLLGSMPTGNNFVTTGPDEIQMIVRDPYGSNSYAFLEKGTVIASSQFTTFSNTTGIDVTNKVFLGGKTVTFAGVGAGVILETKVDNNITVGFNQEYTKNSDRTTSKTTTTTKRWQTSDDPSFVGAAGDVYIGNSTNIVYGKAVNIKFIDATNCTTCTDNTVSGFKIGQDVGLRVNPEFNTAFMYSQSHIETALIPNLTMLRDAFLKKASNYISKYAVGNTKYGSKNTTGAPTTTGYSGGDSYNYTIPTSWPSDKHYEDTVAFYNKQIQNWQNVIAKNEKEKLEAKLVTNLSFDAGVNYESSTTVEYDTTTSSSFEFTVTPSLAADVGFTALGLGMNLNMQVSNSTNKSNGDGSTSVASTTFGYVLADGDAGDYYSIDVKDPKTQTGPVFSVLGGQTSCPYVGVELSKYHDKGKILSEATAKREVPQIACTAPIVNAVPEDQKAIYTIQLMNASETNDDMWFMLEVNASKNADGARVALDGGDIGNGKLIKVPAGTSLNKTISIEKIKPDVFNYEDIELILHSVCQPEDIADTVSLTARFQPVCTKVLLSQPIDKWLINTSKIVYDGTQIKTIPLSFNISNYNLSHTGFEKILVQYKPTSSSQWISDMVYYVDQAQFTAASQPKTYIGTSPSLQYTFEMKSLQDRNYDVRVTSTCANGTTNSSSISTGIKDTKRPKLFGTPQPADGILSPGEDVSIQFDENIQASLLISRNFQVKGVLNGAEIRHNSVLYFDGVDDNASVIAGPDLKDKQFTVEFWTQRSSTTAGVIFSQGTLEIGFNASNNLFVKLGNQTLTTSQTFTSTVEWTHFAVSYTHSDRKLSVFMNDQIPLDNVTVTGVFEPTGRVYVGRNLEGTSHYKGYLHELRIWEKARGFGTTFANMLATLSGSEVGIVGYWPMDDSRGSIATDKSRSHHAILNGAAWAVFPRGYAMNFNGTNYFTIPTASSVVVTNEMDMTMEFWFKATKKPNQVLFSNGKGDLSDPTPPYNNIWVVGSDDLGKLYVLNNGKKLSVTKEVFDNEWHHLAVVVNRVANTSVYVDGNVEAFDLSSNFGGLSGAKMSLGASMFTSAGNTNYNNYFEGKIDEFRIWKLARTRKLLEMDMNSKLKGDEKGLLAYYPFDKYDVDLVLQSNVADNVTGSTLVPTAYTSTTSNLDIPNLKDARPVQNVAYEWVTNGDKIILNIKEPANLVEKTVLEFTVEDVEDLNENLLSSPITWTAFVKKNTVIWNSSSASFEKKQYDPLSFNLDILNIGGTEQNFEISNLPSWLTVNESKGTLAPDSKKTLVFTVSPAVNIGSYEQSIFLSSDFGFKEKFDLNLKVFAEKPNWVLDASKYQYNMSIVGTVSINGTVSTNADDMIGAFVNDTLRGVTSLQYVPAYDMYMVFLDVFSNKADGETVEFKVWNASKGKIHVNVDSNQAFLKDIILGAPSKPVEFKAVDNVSSAYYLEKGWNWISFNLSSKSLKKSSSIFSELSSADGDLVKGMGKFDQFGSFTSWIGEISKQGGFSLKEGYKMKVAHADTFHIVGQSVLIDTINIALKTGWNWIGFPSQSNIEINNAMANVNFDNGDFIKGQRSFASFDKNLGWLGSLKYLVPHQAYMLQTKLPHTFSFPNPDLLNARMENLESVNGTAPWNVNPNDFANTMSVNMSLNICNEAIDPANDFIGAFVGTECRGYIEPTYVSSLGSYRFFLTLYANTSSEIVTFKYFDGSAAKEYPVQQSLVFVNDQITGTLSDPFKVDLTGSVTCNSLSINDQLTESSVDIYPNPFTNSLKIKLTNVDVNDVKLSITNGFGQTVASPKLMNGEWEWDGTSDHGNELSAGVYILSVKKADKIATFKLIKQ